MAEILVLAEHTGGEVKKITGELLTLARQFGEPAADFGVVGDLFQVVPQLLEELGKRKG